MKYKNARECVEALGKRLLGKTVTTIPLGDYLGGEAVVTEIYPDPNCPDIVFNVLHPEDGDMGILEWEPVEIIR